MCNPTDNLKRSTCRNLSPVRAALALLAGLLLTAAPAGAAGLLVAEGPFGGVLAIESHDVVVTINNGVAVTEVTQVFVNTEDRQLEALYTFPVPRAASVANFSMWINGKEMVGEVVEKQRAREIYNSYKQVNRDPGLLEQTDYRTFQMRIFPIPPKARQKVKICYYQEIDADNDWVTYVYPLATTAAGQAAGKTTGRVSLALHAKSAVPIAEMESPSHKAALSVARHADTYYQASIETPGGDLKRDVVVAYRLARPATGLDLITSRDEGDGYFCLSLTAGPELAGGAGPMDYLFVLDVSGSMADDGKLKVSRECIAAFLGELTDKDRFEVVTFNIRPATLFNRLMPGGGENAAAARKFLETRQASGGTTLTPALQVAYKYRDSDRPLNVVVFSDGLTEQKEYGELMAAVEARPAGVRVFTVGVGNDVNRPLMQQLADKTGALAAFLSHGDDFARQAKAFRRKLLAPAIADVKIEFAGGGVYDLQPAMMPSLYHGSPVRLYGRYSKPGAAAVRLSGSIRGAAFSKEAPITLPAKDVANPEIQRMWAWHKVQALSNGPTPLPDAAVKEIVRLGEGYSIATPYTSFLVLENDAEYARWRLERRNALLVARDARAREALQARLEALRTKSLAALGPDQADGKAPTQTPAPAPQVSAPTSGNSWDVGTVPQGKSGGGKGGGPMGLLGLVIVAALAVAGKLNHRRSDTTCTPRS